jgi:hypothetical protein
MIAAFLLASAALCPAAGLACAADTVPPQAVQAAFAHARTVVPEGEILVSLDPEGGSDADVAPIVSTAAAGAGFKFSENSDDGIVCSESRGCVAVGDVRGLVHVWGLEATGADRAVVTIRVLTVQDTPGVLYEQVDDVHVARREHGTGWRITRVVRVSQS